MKRIGLVAGIAAVFIGIGLYVLRPDSANDPQTAELPTELPLRKLVVHPQPRAIPAGLMTAPDGTEIALDSLRGKMVVLNFWATWCAPCREEMPSLNALQKTYGSESFEVVALATGRNAPAAIDRFFAEQQIDTLTAYRDPNMAIAREMAVLGLPVTVVLNPQGKEIARLTGDADWFGTEALDSLAALGLKQE